ncbi:MAG: hypothetical protein IKO68_01615 [Oscillospiraceae bacterium]|nr:hypothetical protein [Oscillospiraceae bacterium]
MTNDRILLTDIDFTPTKESLLRNRIFTGDPDAPQVKRLLERCAKVVRPRVLAALVEVEHDPEGRVVSVGGETMSSPVLDRQMASIHRAFAFVATSGRELAAVDYAGDQALSRALLAVGVAAVHAAMERLGAELEARYHIGKTAEVNPGSLPEWPTAEQDKIFRILGDVEGDIGVTLGENHFMTPLASSSGLLYETEQDYQNCTYCTNLNCPIRRTPYDPAKAAELRK